MNYIEYKISGVTQEQADILVAELAELGFDSFSEWEEGSMSCYIPAEQCDKIATQAMLNGVQYTVNEIRQQNWNSIWESSFEPIEVDGRCYIRATFHEPHPEVEHEIVITPKMSFGTGHHPTTHLVVEMMLDERFDTMQGLDMGSGTGILAILAAQRGATVIDAIDIDEWAYENCLENIVLNSTQGVVCPILGDASAIDKRFDFVLANINRNILLRDMPIYVDAMREGAMLIVSGILEFDIEAISARAAELGLRSDRCKQREGWAALKFTKNQGSV